MIIRLSNSLFSRLNRSRLNTEGCNLPIILMILGAVLVICGVYGLIAGLPYLVLERGFTQAIMGSVLVTGGLVLIGIGLLMRDMRRLFARLASGSGALISDGPKADAANANLSSTDLATKGALAAGTAGAVAAGALLAGDDAAAAETGKDDLASQDEFDFQQEHHSQQEPHSQEKPLSPEDAVVLATDSAGETLEGDTPIDEVIPADEAIPADEVIPADEAANAIVPVTVDTSDGPAAPAEDLSEPASAETPDEDPFERLRRSLLMDAKPALSDAVAAGMSVTDAAPSDMDAAPSDTDAVAEAASDEITQDASVSALATDDEDTPAVAADGASKDGTQPFGSAQAANGPTASDEGIVSVRRIGDSTYTMFADGSVAAETPNGPLTFASVAELKAHLTARVS
jgi:hypothetical protein